MRELIIAVDDETKSIGLRGNDHFSLLELFGIAEHLKLIATAEDNAQIQMALAQRLEEKIQIARAAGDPRWRN
jgi:hypothetical protein